MWFLLLIIFITYSRSISIYFSGDDWVFLYGALRGLDLPYIFSFSPGSFAPLINLAFLVFYKLFHLNQIYYHLVVLSIHSLNCILFLRIIQELHQDKKLAFLTVILFSVFSPYNQIIIWINGLPGLITSVFFLSSLCSFIIYRKYKKYTYCFFSLSSFILALLCKEWAVTAFGLFILYDILFYYKSSRESLLKLVKVYIPFVAILILYLSAELFSPYSGKKDMIGPHLFSNLSTYLTTFIIPSQNISEMPIKIFIPLLNTLLPPLIKIFSILLPALSLTAIIWGSNFIRFYILWIYVTLFPFLFFPWGTASRYYYLASMGVSALLAYLFLNLYKTAKNKIGKTALSLGLILFIIVHIFFIEIRITKLYRRNREIQKILSQLQNIAPHFPPNSRLFFSGFNYDRKWGYAVRTIYRDHTLIVYRTLPSADALKDTSSPLFIFNYKSGFLTQE